MKVEDIDFDNILLDQNSYERILIYDISYKIFMGAKPSRLRIDRADGVIKTYDRTRYLEFFGFRIYNTIYDRINYLISKRSGITYTWHIILIIILEASELNNILLYL